MQSYDLDQLHRHNERIGTELQLAVQRFVLIYIFGLIVYPVLHFLFKLEIRGRHIIGGVGERFVYAAQHFYEWDPLLLWCAGVWPLALQRQYFIANSIGGTFWARSSLLRALSWVLGIMFTIKGHEPKNGSIERAARLLNGPLPLTIAIYPTGPIGRKRESRIYRGISFLAEYCPKTPIVPVALRGLQEITIWEVLQLKRPRLVIEFSPPIFGADLLNREPAERMPALHEMLADAWSGGRLSTLREVQAPEAIPEPLPKESVTSNA